MTGPAHVMNDDARRAFGVLLDGTAPLLALAPMQDITDLGFWRLVSGYGGADVYYTEYFRVHPTSRLEPWILQSVVENPTGRPVVAQLIGSDVPSLVRNARALQRYPVAAIDLNLGCPAPVVFRKGAGGGLLRDLEGVDAILGALREAVTVAFTVKTRVGFASAEIFDELLDLLARHSPDLVVVHGRTVQQRYRGQVRYDLIRRAAERLHCPVVANGDIDTWQKVVRVLAETGARGVMIGRGAVRNPWLFAQCRQHLRGEPVTLPCGRDVLDYVRRLYESMRSPRVGEAAQVERLKKFMNFIGAGVEPAADFLHRVRRVRTEADFFAVCTAFLDHDRPMPLAAPDGAGGDEAGCDGQRSGAG